MRVFRKSKLQEFRKYTSHTVGCWEPTSSQLKSVQDLVNWPSKQHPNPNEAKIGSQKPI